MQSFWESTEAVSFGTRAMWSSPAKLAEMVNRYENLVVGRTLSSLRLARNAAWASFAAEWMAEDTAGQRPLLWHILRFRRCRVAGLGPGLYERISDQDQIGARTSAIKRSTPIPPQANFSTLQTREALGLICGEVPERGSSFATALIPGSR